MNYEWDWDGDGAFDHGMDGLTGGMVLYQTAATYHPLVRVTDNAGATATDTVTITVSAAPPEDWTGVVADIRPNSEALRTLSKSGGEYQTYELVLLNGDGSPAGVTPGEIFWVWDGVVYGTAIIPEVEVQANPMQVIVYSAFAEITDHLLTVSVTKSDGTAGADATIAIHVVD